jgi:predicted nucleic acid-binding protein
VLQVNDWATCPLTESGFMRISMTTAYQATFDNARKSLATLRALRGHRFLSDDVDAASLPVLSSYKDTTDAHLVILAKRHGLKLATLDGTLIAKPWAAGVAENPLLQRIKS